MINPDCLVPYLLSFSYAHWYYRVNITELPAIIVKHNANAP